MCKSHFHLSSCVDSFLHFLSLSSLSLHPLQNPYKIRKKLNWSQYFTFNKSFFLSIYQSPCYAQIVLAHYFTRESSSIWCFFVRFSGFFSTVWHYTYPLLSEFKGRVFVDVFPLISRSYLRVIDSSDL